MFAISIKFYKFCMFLFCQNQNIKIDFSLLNNSEENQRIKKQTQTEQISK